MTPAYVIDGLNVVKNSNQPQTYIINNLRKLQYCTISDDISLAAFDNQMISLTNSAHLLNLKCKRITYERTKHILGGFQCSFRLGTEGYVFIAHMYLRPLNGDWKGGQNG